MSKMSKLKKIIFDVDGVLIEADKIRIQKYKELFKKGMEMVKSDLYAGTDWLFPKLKEMYDDGVIIEDKFYKLINKKTPKILDRLSKKYELCVYSRSSKEVTEHKLKATGIDKYFKDIYVKPLERGRKSIAVVDDRFNESFGKGYYTIKFNYGQHKDRGIITDKVISNIKELCGD